jgi:hypothetical protein
MSFRPDPHSRRGKERDLSRPKICSSNGSVTQAFRCVVRLIYPNAIGRGLSDCVRAGRRGSFVWAICRDAVYYKHRRNRVLKVGQNRRMVMPCMYPPISPSGPSLSLKRSRCQDLAFVSCMTFNPTGKEACQHPAAVTAQADGTSAPNAYRSRAPAPFHLLQS